MHLRRACASSEETGECFCQTRMGYTPRMSTSALLSS